MHKITLFILSTNGTSPKQLTFSRAFLFFWGFFLTACTGLIGYGAYDYYHLRKVTSHRQELEQMVSYQKESLALQHQQIQKFASKINTLKTEIISLNNFERQVRVIAGLEESSEEQHNIFGIGGSIPEDLDESLQLSERHNTLIREMHEQVDQLNAASANQKKGFESLLEDIEVQRNLLAATPAIRPAKGLVTSRFGTRKSPFTGMKEFHKGLDIANVKGTPVLATADGVVTFADKKGGLGKVVIINHGHGLVTRYAHLDEFLKKSGDTIKRGEVVGLIGNTGRSTGCHVHYEVHLNGIPVNPETYILN